MPDNQPQITYWRCPHCPTGIFKASQYMIDKHLEEHKVMPDNPMNPSGLHRIKLTNHDILLILDHLEKGFTEYRFKKDRKRADAVYETYQTIGQALGEKDIVLEFGSKL